MTIKKAFFIGGMFLAVIGVVMFSLGLGGLVDSVFSWKTVNYFGTYNWRFVTIDVHKYLKGLEEAIKLNQLINIIPKFPSLPKTPEATDLLGWLKYVARILSVFVPNILIFLTNMMLWPIKIFVYPVRILLVLIGVDGTTNEFAQAIKAIYTFGIPQIVYW